MTIATILDAGKPLPTFFTGGRSPVMDVTVTFRNGYIVDIAITNEPPADAAELKCCGLDLTMLCCCCCYCCNTEDRERTKQEMIDHADSVRRQVTLETQRILNAEGHVTNDGTVRRPVQRSKGDGNFITNVFMRFDTSERHEHARLVGVRFEIDDKPEPPDKWDWIGQKEGGKVVNLLQTQPSSGEIGRKGAVVALKGVRESHDESSHFIAIEWLCEVFPQIVQRSNHYSQDIQVIAENSLPYDEEIIPLIHGDPRRFKREDNTKTAKKRREDDEKGGGAGTNNATSAMRPENSSPVIQ
mmetsp:Transcript_22134/g.43066  ORF Transcript_22134/g.43066 Transcript_22134/m.43066 type:complete len:299 (+) Transcript_22134:376-1272(+)